MVSNVAGEEGQVEWMGLEETRRDVCRTGKNFVLLLIDLHRAEVRKFGCTR